MASTGYSLAAGTVSTTTLQANTAAVVANWTRQTDQLHFYDWKVTLKTVVKDQKRVKALNSSTGYFGYESGVLMFQVLTPLMLTYLWTNIFSSLPSVAVTIQVPHQRDGWKVYNAMLEWCDLSSNGDLARPQTGNVEFPFYKATLATYGRAFSSAFSTAFG